MNLVDSKVFFVIKLKKIISVFFTFFTSMSLLSFASSAPAEGDDYIDEAEFNQHLDELSPTLDRDSIYGEEDLELENELSESDIETIGDFVSYDKTHIELDDTVYQIMPVNDLYVSPEVYVQIKGEEYDYGPLSYEDEYLINYKKLTYVEDNMSLMNYMVENEFGYIDENGEIQFYEDDFIQQSLFMNFRAGWFKISFTTNYWGSIIFGALGLLLNSDLVKNAKDFLNAREDVVKNCFTDVATNLIYEGCDYYGNLVISLMAKAVSTTMSIKEIVSQTTFVGRLIKILKYILGHYAPGMIRGTIMILDGVFLQYGTDVEIGLWWSNYNILRCKVY